MPRILLIETATEYCGAAISINGEVVSFRENPNSTSHASLLTIQIQNILSENNLKISDLDAVAVSKGPGSYTSLRVGISVAKGICYAANLPLIAINTLQALAAAAKKETILNGRFSGSAFLIPMIDARRMEVCMAVYNSSLEEIVPPHQKILSNILSENDFFPYFEKNKDSVLIFVGTGLKKAKNVLSFENAEKIKYIDIFECRVHYLTNLAFSSFQLNDFQSLAYFEPQYFKNPTITSARNAQV